MIILGVDPGSLYMGYGLVRCTDISKHVLDYGTLTLTDTADTTLRLKKIYDFVTDLLVQQQPSSCAIEMPVYGQNPQSMLKLGRAQAAAMLSALNGEIPVTQYSPKEVKQAVTGNGNASKKQVWYMVRSLLSITDDDKPLDTDASDALAVAICHSHRKEGASNSPSHKDWAAFLRENPQRRKS